MNCVDKGMKILSQHDNSETEAIRSESEKNDTCSDDITQCKTPPKKDCETTDTASEVTSKVCGQLRLEEPESPKRSPKRNRKKCNDECENTRSGLNRRLSNLEKEKLTLQQKLDTVEKHQEALRCTISSKEGLIVTQTKLIADHLKTIDSQKQLIADLEIKVETHSDLANSFLDVIVAEEGEELDIQEGRDENQLLQKMHEKIKSLEETLSSSVAKIKVAEDARDVEITVSAELKKKLDSKSKEYNGLKNHLGVVEETTLLKEKEIRELKDMLADGQGKIETITIDNNKLRTRLCELETSNNKLCEKFQNCEVNSTDLALVQQLTEKMNEKDQEILELKKSIDFSETALNEAKMAWKGEMEVVKRLQGLLENEKGQRIQSQDKCCTLRLKLSEAKTHLARRAKLQDLSAENKGIPPGGELLDNTQTKGNTNDGKLSKEPPVMQVASKVGKKKTEFVCIYELREPGTCRRKEKCNYVHDFSPTLRDDEAAVN